MQCSAASLLVEGWLVCRARKVKTATGPRFEGKGAALSAGPNVKAAVDMWQKAAAMNDPTAQFHLGRMYLLGDKQGGMCVEHDTCRAIRCCQSYSMHTCQSYSMHTCLVASYPLRPAP